MLLINKTLIRMAKGLWPRICLIALLKLLALAGTAYFADIMSGFLGSLTSPDMDISAAGTAVFYALIAAAIILLSDILTGEAEFRCTSAARKKLRASIFQKVLELDVGNIEKIGPVSAITTSVDGVEAMTVYYGKYLPGLIYSILAPVYMFFRLKDASFITAVFLFVISIVLMPVNNLFRGHIESLKGEYWESLEDMTGYYLENVQGLTTIKLFNREEDRTEGLRKRTDAFNKKIMDVMKVNFSSFLLTDGMIYLAVLLSAIITASQLASGTISISAALMVLMLSFSFFSSVRSLMNATHSALAGVSAADKVEKLLDIDTSRPYDPGISPAEVPFKGISAEHISFAYEGRNAALKDISMKIPKDKVTALVGLSGCGKSTVASLLMRFSDPAGGHILIDGIDYTSLTPEELRKHIIMVPQTVNLFSGTIAENLRIAAPDATDEELYEALKAVRLSDWVMSLDKKINSDVGDAGARLSGGQKQKIGIARALLCKAEYIIFDECTSAVDPESERDIRACIASLANSRTLIIISHRLSAIRSADMIYVLSGGTVAESGTHDELMSKNGIYTRLTTEQAELEAHGEANCNE